LSWLVTGGAGYIGSHVADVFIREGCEVVVIDDLSTGKRSFVPEGAVFAEGSVNDSDLLDTVFATHSIDGVIHLAGFKFAGESVTHPLAAYTEKHLGKNRSSQLPVIACRQRESRLRSNNRHRP